MMQAWKAWSRAQCSPVQESIPSQWKPEASGEASRGTRKGQHSSFTMHKMAILFHILWFNELLILLLLAGRGKGWESDIS